MAACTAGNDSGDSASNDFATNDAYSRLPYIHSGSDPTHSSLLLK